MVLWTGSCFKILFDLFIALAETWRKDVDSCEVYILSFPEYSQGSEKKFVRLHNPLSKRKYGSTPYSIANLQIAKAKTHDLLLPPEVFFKLHFREKNR